MKVTLVIKIIVLLFILTFMVMFFIENRDPVPMYFPIIKARHVGLTFIMLGAYAMGIASSALFITLIGAKIKKKRKLQELLEEEKGELFEEE